MIMKKKILLFLLALVSIESALWAVPEGALVVRGSIATPTSDIPFAILKAALPGTRPLKDGQEIGWTHVLNVSPTASRKEINNKANKLLLQFHPDKCAAPYAENIYKIVGEAKEKGITDAGTRALRVQLLQKSIYIAEIYALYRIIKTNWFKKRVKKLRTSIQKRTPIIDKSLRFTIFATAKTSSFAWNSLKIGLGLGATGVGIILCGIGIRCGYDQPFTSKPYITISTADGNTINMRELFAPVYCVQASDGSYTWVTFDGNNLIEINNQLKGLPEDFQDQAVSGTAVAGLFAGIPLTIGGIELTLSGISGFKELFAKKKEADQK